MFPIMTMSFFSDHYCKKKKKNYYSFFFSNNNVKFVLQQRNNPYILNSTVSYMVTAMPYRIQPSILPKHATSVSL